MKTVTVINPWDSMPSVFDGWTSDRQLQSGGAQKLETRWRFHIFPYVHARYCAFQWALDHGGERGRDRAFERIHPYLIALFPRDPLIVRAPALCAGVYANDFLRLPAEKFIEFDKRAQWEELQRAQQAQLAIERPTLQADENSTRWGATLDPDPKPDPIPKEQPELIGV